MEQHVIFKSHATPFPVPLLEMKMKAKLNLCLRSMYVRFRNYILIYETFFQPHSFLSSAFILAWLKYVVKLRFEGKANESGWKRRRG